MIGRGAPFPLERGLRRVASFNASLLVSFVYLVVEYC